MKNLFYLATAAAAITFLSLPGSMALARKLPNSEAKATAAPAATLAAATTAPVEAKPATTTEPRKRRTARHRKSAHRDYLHFVPFDQLW